MKNYLSFGGGVNSVALHLLLLDQGVEFESVFVHHGTDWPETYDYVDTFQKWLNDNGHQRVTVLVPNEQGFSSLYEYALSKSMVPAIYPRWCTRQFKIKHIMKYYDKPCFNMIGIDAGEAKRAKISIENGVENRFPLIEADIDREGCKAIIKKKHGLPIPQRSGCYICPFQRRSQWVELRKKHPELFCKAQILEKKNMEYRIAKGKKPLTLSGSGKRLSAIVDEGQMQIWKHDEYPPCQCGL